MNDAPPSDLDIKERIAMVDHLDMQAQATHRNFELDYRKLRISVAALVGMGVATGVILSWLAL